MNMSRFVFSSFSSTELENLSDFELKNEASFDQEDEVTNELKNEQRTCEYGCCRLSEHGDHLFVRGLQEGRYSDITIKAFDTEYKLHKLVLDRSEYFRSLFSWNDKNEDDDDDTSDSESESEPIHKSQVLELHFDDQYITKDSFELILARLYGTPNHLQEHLQAHHTIAIASYLGLDEVVSACAECIVDSLSMVNIAKYSRFASTNHYGPASERILDSCKGILCSVGWESTPQLWQGIPEEIMAELVGEDCFFVPSEWDRCIFIIELINCIHAWCTLPNYYPTEEEPATILRKVLNEKIYYCHLSAEQLDELAGFTDYTGKPYIDITVLQGALWQSVLLQKSIMKSPDLPTLGLAITTNNEEEGVDNNWYRVPVRDETVSSTPLQLKTLATEHQYTENRSSTATSDGELKMSADLGSELANYDAKTYSWTKIPPFRFSVAFSDASSLSTETRVYAKTLWYAGSYWNLYLQKVKVAQKKGYQMGVYLHRASAPSSSTRNGALNPDIYSLHPSRYYKPFKPSVDNYYTKSPAPSVSLFNRKSRLKTDTDEKEHVEDDSMIIGFDDLHISRKSVEAEEQRSFMTYDDTRSKISVYFVISTPSRRNKAAITSFVSAPDTFNKSQSWGWKSHSMCVFNEDGSFPEEHEQNLKFMVVLGVI